MGLDPKLYKLVISSDHMDATITLLDESIKTQLTPALLIETLNENGVVFGLHGEKINSIVANPKINTPYTVASGKRAEDGKDEEIEYKFSLGKLDAVDEAKGSIDHRDIHNFINITKGTLLAVKTPATEGVPGSTVKGEEHKARNGKTKQIKVGKGAQLSGDGYSVTSDVDGHACLIADRITVMNTVEVPAHVDYSIGNIDFIGNVKIRGGVKPDFRVKAKGDIEINDNVEKAEIVCGGNLIIRGIVFGQGACKITVEGDANIGALDQATVKVKGALKVKSYIRHCNVASGGIVELTGKKGNIVGGDIHAYQGITSPYIGNTMATMTKLTVGTNPFMSHELEELISKQEGLEAQLKQVNAGINTIDSRKIAGELDPKNKAILAKLTTLKRTLDPQLKAVLEEMEHVKAQFSENKDAKIKVNDIIYPGVIISFRDRMQYKTQDEQQRLSFYEDAAEIRTGPY